MKATGSFLIVIVLLFPLNFSSARKSSEERTIGWMSSTALKKKAPVKLKLYSAPSIKAYMKTIRVEKNSDFRKISSNTIVRERIITETSSGIPIRQETNGFYKLQGGAWVMKKDVVLISLEEAFVKTIKVIMYTSKNNFYKSPGKDRLSDSETAAVSAGSFLTPVDLKIINDDVWVKVIDVDPPCPLEGEAKLKGPLWIPLYGDDGTMNLYVTDKEC